MANADNSTIEGKAAYRRSELVADPEMAPLLKITKQ